MTILSTSYSLTPITMVYFVQNCTPCAQRSWQLTLANRRWTGAVVSTSNMVAHSLCCSVPALLIIRGTNTTKRLCRRYRHLENFGEGFFLLLLHESLIQFKKLKTDIVFILHCATFNTLRKGPENRAKCLQHFTK